ncbi:hypothetical protein Tco_0721039 [Tanacetum coccineum]
MSTLKFVDTHNMIAFLKKPTESDGFEEIVDFLKASSIKYALTVNPTIYTSCIKQFWDTAKAKTVNGEVQIHAQVDGKKVVVTESAIRRDLQLEDATGDDCLPNAKKFEQLARMGLQPGINLVALWLCLANNRKFKFSMYIFESMVKNLDSAGKFLMYPRFVQVFLDNQVEGMDVHHRVYVPHTHTKKIFANMKRQGKDFLERITPLFPTMMVQVLEEIGEGSLIPASQTTLKTYQSSKSRRKDIGIPQSSVPRDDVANEAVNEEMSDRVEMAATTASSLDAEHDIGNIHKTQSMATLNEPSPQRTGSSSGPSHHDTIGDVPI